MRHFLGTNADDITDYLVTSQCRLLEMLSSEPPESRNAREIVTLPTMPQFRTTRRLDGDYTLREEDVYRHFDDSIGAICDFDRRDCLYEMPWRTMVKKGFGNLIAAGRITSGEGYAWDVIRVIPPAILTGEVAGIAAALSLESGKSVHSIDIAELQRRITAAGNLIHFDDAWVSNRTNRIEKIENASDTGHM